jgi:molybdopterin/thiamine biosynthesis adenylyltransferase
MRVTVIGVGALGSHVVLFLRNEATTIKCIDFDRVESKNVLSQFHSKSHIGKSKVESLKQTMQFLYGVKVEVVPHRLTSDNTNVLSGADLLIDCLDNAPSRALVQQYALEWKVPCLHGALATDAGFGRAVWTESFAIDAGAEGGATCEDGEHLPYIAVTAACLARAAQVYLKTGQKVGFQVLPTGETIPV